MYSIRHTVNLYKIMYISVPIRKLHILKAFILIFLVFGYKGDHIGKVLSYFSKCFNTLIHLIL